CCVISSGGGGIAPSAGDRCCHSGWTDGTTEVCPVRLARPIHVCTMFNSHDPDGVRIVIEPVDDAIGTSPGRPVPLQLVPESLAALPGRFDARTYQELHDRRGRTVGKPGQRALSRTGERKLPRSHFVKYLARNSSAVTTRPWSISDSAFRISRIALGLESIAR